MEGSSSLPEGMTAKVLLSTLQRCTQRVPGLLSLSCQYLPKGETRGHIYVIKESDSPISFCVAMRFKTCCKGEYDDQTVFS